MFPIRQTVRLSLGRATLHAWPAATEQGYLLDLLTLTLHLGALRDAGEEWTAEDVEPHIWRAFERLLDASLPTRPPGPLTWGDTLTLLGAMYELNDVEELLGKLTGLMERSSRLSERLRRQAATKAPQTTATRPSMNS